MKALSQSEYGEIRSLYESMYAPKEVIAEELIDEIIDELVEELISEGVDEEEAYSLVEEATDTYIDEAKVTFGSDTAPIRKSGAPVGARRRYGMRKAGDALQGAKKAAGSAYKTAKSKAAGAAVDVAVAGSMAKKKAGEVKKAAQEAPGKAKAAVTTAASDVKKKAKSGIKGFIKRQAQKVVSRMSEETVEELEATGLFTVKEIEAIMEEEINENRRAASAAGGYKDDSKKQTDPSKAGFTGISNSIADIMKQNKEIEARKKK